MYEDSDVPTKPRCFATTVCFLRVRESRAFYFLVSCLPRDFLPHHYDAMSPYAWHFCLQAKPQSLIFALQTNDHDDGTCPVSLVGLLRRCSYG